MLKLLSSWGYDGFRKHTEQAAAFYKRKRDNFEHAMQTHLSGLAEWTTPEAGMFYW
jgi:tryptophan aminotransferase